MASALAIDVERDQTGSIQSSSPTLSTLPDRQEAPGSADKVIGAEQFELALRPWPTKRLNEALAELGPARPATVVQLADLPPPSRPQRAAPEFIDAEEIRQSAIPDLGNARLSDDDVAGGELVRALAALPTASPRAVGDESRRPMSVVGESLAEAMDPPPMIIERARAEQTLARLTGPLEITRLSPAPGLAAGFALSLIAGAALFLLMG